jgi:hypothetical protein
MDPFARWFRPDGFEPLDNASVNLQDVLARSYRMLGCPRDSDLEWLAEQARSRAVWASLLTDDDRTFYGANHFVLVRGSSGGLFRLEYGYSGNVIELPRWTMMCAHPVPHGGPHETAMVAQLLAIRYDEPGFRRVANTVGRGLR